ncbi:hypothetical protein TSAR_009414 [Trichomalopsis sarcophagae]|uniref:Uncharacterized protein n=1 Tax=Trichomalopsis sarcophagae TaxID=543379 RepID=A0A232ELM9_9HYME|nr:hypothetical protein TSAR_009414 [Trichomalopsis sarcophagae]
MFLRIPAWISEGGPLDQPESGLSLKTKQRKIGIAMDFGWTMIPHQTETQQLGNDHESPLDNEARLHKFQEESSANIDKSGARGIISVTVSDKRRMSPPCILHRLEIKNYTFLNSL